MIGVVAVLGGVGGAVLFVPLVSSILPIHIDLVRGTGLFVAFAGALSAAPVTLNRSLSRISVAVPFALSASLGSILGAVVGVGLEARTVKLWLGILLFFVVIVTAVTTRRLAPDAQGEMKKPDYSDWWPRNPLPATVLFFGIGFLGGLFGIGAGWANVPLLVALCGAPLRVAAATSGLIILANSATAGWIYLAEGAVDPLLTIAAVSGMIIGGRTGARLLHVVPQEAIRWIVLGLLMVAGGRSIWEAL